MKTLYILRHAKSSWDDPALSDFERPLNPRGLGTAPFMGSLMKERGLMPEIIISSPAFRARETARLVSEAAAFGGEIITNEQIYEASTHRLVEVVQAIGDKYSTAMIVGHNPGMEALVYFLTGEMQPMPTAALAVIELGIDRWADIREGCGRLEAVIRPKGEMK